MKRNRIIVDVIIIVSIYIFPWWIPAAIALFSALVFRNFVELIVFATFYDYLYMASSGVFGGLQFPATVVTCALYILISGIKKYTSVND